MKLIDNVKAFVKEYFTKNNLIIILIAGSIGSAVYFVDSRSKNNLLKAQLEASKTINTIVEKEKHRLDSLIVVKTNDIKNRDAIILAKDKKIEAQDKTITVLQDSLKHTLINVNSVSADSSYKYINFRIKPIAELKYPFDSVQVKVIHYTFVERDGLFDISSKQGTLITDLRMNSGIKDNQITELKALNSTYISKEGICNTENIAYKEEIKALNKSIKQQKFVKTTSNVAVVGLVGYIIIHSLVK